ncbi:tyrosine-type recombinase/integrase [Poriferisphaera corsica]|nr:site-specific integrase [Poriferisphaera corsica]
MPIRRTKPTPPKPSTHHNKPCWQTRWRESNLDTGKTVSKIKRWYNATQSQITHLYYDWLNNEFAKLSDTPNYKQTMLTEELCELYLNHSKKTYTKNGKPTSHLSNVITAINELVAREGKRPMNMMDAPALAKYRDAVIKNPKGRVRHRKTVNEYLSIIKRMYQWGREQGVVNAQTANDLQLVANLQPRRTKAKERKGVKPVAWQTVEATLPHMHKQIQDMILIMWYTGMRPQEVCVMRTKDIDTTSYKGIWVYRPHISKLDHLDDHEDEDNRKRVIAIGKTAQEIITPYLLPRLEKYIFDPREAPNANNKATGRYTSDSLGKALKRACDRAFFPSEPPLCREEGETIGKWRYRVGRDTGLSATYKAHRDKHRWNLNQLRHSRATELNKHYNMEAAQVSLGHSSLNTAQIYAEKNLELAVEIARDMG